MKFIEKAELRMALHGERACSSRYDDYGSQSFPVGVEEHFVAVR